MDKVIKKAINVKTKASCQTPSGTQETDFHCPRGLRPVKNNKIRESKDLKKTKSYYSISTN